MSAGAPGPERTAAAAEGRFRELLAGEPWERLAALGEVVAFAGGAVVLRRGDASTWLFVVVEGALEVVDARTTPPTVLAARGPGHVLGEMSFVDGSPVSAEVRARGATRALRLDTARLRAAMAADPALDAAFHRALAAVLGFRIRSMTTAVVTGGLAPAPSTGPVDLPTDALLEATLRDADRAPRRVPITGERLRVGRDRACEVVVPDPRLAGVHAELVRVEDGWRVVSKDGRAVAVDGVPVTSAALREGAVVSVGRFDLTFGGGAVDVAPAGARFALEARGLRREAGGRTLLHDVSFTALSGEVVALVGPSGAGKTTLLGALSGAAPADAGEVRIGGRPLREALAERRTLVAEVPQDDIVVPELTVEESLRATARLRLPGATEAEREARVNRVISSLGLDPVRGSRIGDPEARGLSGGQRKRVNVGQELVADDTWLLVLDEPTSGLDPRSADEVARLARRLADAGRVVILVTHDLSDALLAQVDQLLVMAPGGHLAWFGPVRAALEAFRVTSAARIFDRLAEETGATWAERYRASPAGALWGRERSERAAALPAVAAPPSPGPGLGAQLATLAARAARAKVRDRGAVAVLTVQPLLVAAVVALVFPRPTTGLLFLVTLASFWFGMSAAVRELVADRVLWRRERRAGVSPLAWVGAKAAVLAGVVALQCAGCAAVSALAVGVGEGGFPLPALIAVEVATGWVGAAIGLWVSTLWRRSDAAVGTIVLLLVPQIAFSGMLTPLDQLPVVARALAWATPLRYALHLALVQGAELHYLKLGEWHARPVSGELFLLGLRPAGEGELGLPAAVLAAALAAFGCAAFGGAVRGAARVE